MLFSGLRSGKVAPTAQQERCLLNDAKYGIGVRCRVSGRRVAKS
jgi:hypothetical protein